jgi:peptidoglycan/LPS O-acetylase OafA/YrhL
VSVASWLPIVALIVLAHTSATPQLGIWVNSFVQFQFFGMGTLLVLLMHRRDWIVAPIARWVMGLGALSGFFVAVREFHLTSSAPVPARALVLGYLIVLASSVLIFLSVLNSRSRLWPRLSYQGRISFGLYVFHPFVLQAFYYPSDIVPRWSVARNYEPLVGFVALLVTVCIASVSYHFFERPINRFKARFAYVPSGATLADERPVAVAAAADNANTLAQ